MLPKIFTLFVLWGAVGYLIIYIDPERVKDVGGEGLYLPMIVLAASAIWYSVLTATKSFGAASLMAFIITVALVTLVLQWMNILIAVSLIGMTAALGLTLVRRS